MLYHSVMIGRLKGVNELHGQVVSGFRGRSSLYWCGHPIYVFRNKVPAGHALIDGKASGLMRMYVLATRLEATKCCFMKIVPSVCNEKSMACQKRGPLRGLTRATSALGSFCLLSTDRLPCASFCTSRSRKVSGTPKPLKKPYCM